MFRKILLAGFLSLLFFQTQKATACDACGCGVGSYQFGILPQQTKNFAGIRYQTKSDASSPNHDLQTKEHFQSLEIWSRFYPVKRVQVLALLPYAFNSQESGGKTTNLQGIGDALVLVNYNLVNNTDSLYQKLKHNLFLGGGLKLPTGNYQKEEEGVLLNPNIQPGTGSLDFLANAMYTIRYGKVGLNTTATYKHNTANRNEFRFGDKVGAGTVLFSVFKVKEAAIMPNAGVVSEITCKDSHYGDALPESGGHATFLTAGTEFYFMNFSAGVTAQKPVSQNVSAGFVQTGNRYLTHFTFLF